MESGGNLPPQPGPPALPVKQRRSLYSEGSSMDMDCEDGELLSPAGLQQQNQPYTDVFSEPVHCQEAQCPIHHGSVSSCCHQEDVFSECFPPPVPHKKLVRAMSLPEGYNPPTVPRRPPRPPVLGLNKHLANLQCFDNPLYMLPLERAISLEHREEPTAVSEKPLLSSNTSDTTPFSQLSFDTPDEQLLPYLLSDAAGVTIAQRHLLFLRSAAHTLEANLLMPGEAGGVSFTPDNFQLCDGYKPRHIGDDVYFKLHCNKFPNKVLGARVYKPDNQSYTTHSIPQTPHVNLQEVLIHFSPSSTQEAAPALRGTQASQPDCTPSRRPLGSSSESVDSQHVSPKNNSSTIIELLERGHAVSVERDLPQATLEDFIQCRCAQQTSDPTLYAKQLCILLLQVVTGLQQLCSNGVIYVELRASNVFLVWPSRAPTASDRAERRMDKEQDAGENNVKEAVQMHWGKQGAPRVVLSNTPYRALSKHYTMSSTNAQIGGLILHSLNLGESFSFVTRCSFPKSTSDPYTERLLDLAGWLQDKSSALQLSDTKTILQALLWGPRAQLFTFNIGSDMATVDSWLTIRRSLLVLKMAERGLLQDGPPLDWEACLCLRYFASCDGEGLSSASERLGLLHKLCNI
ncbi:unnamed protein product [Lota lota]